MSAPTRSKSSSAKKSKNVTFKPPVKQQEGELQKKTKAKAKRPREDDAADDGPAAKKPTPLPKTHVLLLGNVLALLTRLLKWKLPVHIKLHYEKGKVWGHGLQESQLKKLLGTYVINEREVIISRATGNSPGRVLLKGAFTLVSDYLQVELSAFGVVDLVDIDGTFYLVLASEEFVGRLIAKEKELKGLKFQFALPG